MSENCFTVYRLDVPSLEAFKTRLDRALSNADLWKFFPFMAGGLDK